MLNSEIFFTIMPFLWLILTVFLFKKPLTKALIQWFLMILACIILGFFMQHEASALLDGDASLREGIYYGWLLAGFYCFFRIFMKFIEWVLNTLFHETVIIVKIFYYTILLVVAVPFILAMTSVHRIKIGDRLTPKTALELNYENVSWKTSDGLNIRGWFIPANSNRAVLIAHGLGANKSNFLGVVELWHQMNVNVLIFDFRGHGESDGHTVSFGWRESQDIIGGWNFLTQQKKFLPSQIVGYGVSFGGAALIHAAVQIHGFHQLIIDSSFADLDDMAEHIIESEPLVFPWMRHVVKEMGLFFIRIDLGFDIREKSPENVVGRLIGTPILFIHGKGDPLIPWMQSQLLFEHAREPKKLIILNTQGHFGTFNDPDYEKIISSFYNGIVLR